MPKRKRKSLEPTEQEAAASVKPTSKHIEAMIVFTSAIVYFFSNPTPQNYYDYTFRVAVNMLGGHVGLTGSLPPWVNEFVPFEGFWYSVFPLGAVLSMIPFALLKVAGLITEMPGDLIAALCAGLSCFFLFRIGNRYEVERTRLILMTLGVLFGTWTWANLTMAGAWHLALGFAMVGELGAIYFTVYKRRPLIAGIFFALAFGNRTEVLLTAPIFFWLIHRRDAEAERKSYGPVREGAPNASPRLRVAAVDVPALTKFCILPFILGVATLIYNYVRFHSFTDFGYARIPGVLNEPWYKHGIFSYHYIPRQIWEMLFQPWRTQPGFPYLVPDAFSSSIVWSSPFILFAFRRGARDMALKSAAWIAIFVLCILLWMHGNSGGYQFGYRYAMVCLPWLFVIMLESSPKKITPLEWTAYIFSFIVNAYATWLFNWMNYGK